MGQDALTLVTLGAALFVYSPWLLLLLAVAVLPSFLGETHFAALEYSLLFRWTPERRQLDYLRYVGASDETAKEVQMFGLAPWLSGATVASRSVLRGEQAALDPQGQSSHRAVDPRDARLLRRLVIILVRAVAGRSSRSAH